MNRPPSTVRKWKSTRMMAMDRAAPATATTMAAATAAAQRRQARWAFGLPLAAVLVAVAIAFSAYKDGRLTCGRYVLNAYLYVILSLLIASIVATQLGALDDVAADAAARPRRRRNDDEAGAAPLARSLYRGWALLAVFALTIGALLLTMWIDPRRTVAKHAAWLVFVGLFGVMLHPIYAYTRARGVFAHTALTTLAVVVGLTGLAFWHPEWIRLSWGTGLLVALFAGIVLRLLMLLVRPPQNPSREEDAAAATAAFARWRSWDVLLSWAFVVLFSLLLLYDTKRLQVHAAACGSARLPVPDYVNDSVGIFLDVANLFANLGRVQ